MTERAPLCRGTEIAEGEARGFAPWPGARKQVIVLRRGGRLFGWLDSCPHYQGGTPMAWKRNGYLNAARTRLICFSHGAEFDPETGECTLGPCLGKRLRAMPVIEDTDGMVRLTDGSGETPETRTRSEGS